MKHIALQVSLGALLTACGGDVAVIKAPVDNDSDGYTVEVDCDDAQREVHPSATEVCNGIDEARPSARGPR